ncbi:hypothetical protein MYU51_009671 [Penicillium brevicompactum]
MEMTLTEKPIMEEPIEITMEQIPATVGKIVAGKVVVEKSTTDVFMSIDSEDANEIARGRRSHEHRSYPLPESIERIWLYSKSPVNAIEYVICISHEDSEPIAPDENHRYSYKINQVWMLRHPVGIRHAVAIGALARAPGKYCWVPMSFLKKRPYDKQYHLRQK